MPRAVVLPSLARRAAKEKQDEIDALRSRLAAVEGERNRLLVELAMTKQEVCNLRAHLEAVEGERNRLRKRLAT